MRVGAQFLHAVLSGLKCAKPEDVGAALSIVIASSPRLVREAFERHYAEDRLNADDVLATWRPVQEL
jgi:hypothetical protein